MENKIEQYLSHLESSFLQASLPSLHQRYDVLRGFFSPRRNIPSGSSGFCSITQSTDVLQTTALGLGRRDQRRLERDENWGQRGRHPSLKIFLLLLTQFESPAITDHSPPSTILLIRHERHPESGNHSRGGAPAMPLHNVQGQLDILKRKFCLYISQKIHANLQGVPSARGLRLG